MYLVEPSDYCTAFLSPRDIATVTLLDQVGTEEDHRNAIAIDDDTKEPVASIKKSLIQAAGRTGMLSCSAKKPRIVNRLYPLAVHCLGCNAYAINSKTDFELHPYSITTRDREREVRGLQRRQMPRTLEETGAWKEIKHLRAYLAMALDTGRTVRETQGQISIAGGGGSIYQGQTTRTTNYEHTALGPLALLMTRQTTLV
ncbi:hypothetical protein EDB19DRAFT_88458 [Suillus lakei]|nr:hypothetical protein EDB19DRAFT_88458 [Suillus lakei]